MMARGMALAAALALSGAGAALAQDAGPATQTPPPAEALAQAPPPVPFADLPIPAPSRVRPAENTDEGGLWGISERAEINARHSGELENEPRLNAYLRGLTCYVAAEACGDVRLYIMNRPFFNASMAPNGYMEVWSGLLLRVEDEAQLAFVLGHEVGHYDRSHTIAMLRTVRSRATAALILSIGLGAVGAGVVGDLVYLGTLASVFSYSRDNELESDAIGYQRAVARGYDPGAGVRLWSNLIAEAQASDNPDVRRREARASVFATHPLSADRVQALAALSQGAPAGEIHRERYRAQIRPFLDRWLRAELRRRDFSQTLLLLDRLGAHGEDLGMVEYYRGEVYRIRRGEGDAARAAERYVAAIAHPDAPAAAWREVGEIEARAGRNAAAVGYFRLYLERAPNAGDRALVESRITQLGGAQ